MREHGIYDQPNLRKTVEGILYRMRTGLPWRDLPSFLCSLVKILVWNLVDFSINQRLTFKNQILFKTLIWLVI